MKRFLLQVFSLILLVASSRAQTLEFNLLDGKTGKPVSDGVTVKKTATAPQQGVAQAWRFALKNTSSQQRWLYLNWRISFPSPDELPAIHYWDGRAEAVTGGAILQRKADKNDGLMMQAAYDQNTGLALALPPDQIVSQFTQTLESAKDNQYILHLQIPLVLDAGQGDEFPVEIYRFVPRYGYLDALQKYFAAHPAAFSARTNIDPKAAGVGDGSLVRWKIAEGEEIATETARRFHVDWDWLYAPFKRTGDIYGRQEFWDYETARPSDAWRALGKTAAEYQPRRAAELQQLHHTGAIPAFYTPSFLYCEVNLANEKYPGAIIRNADGSYYKLYTTPWVTGPDNDVMVYPWGNAFAAQSMKDAKQLVAENDVPAFGYDVMFGGVRFRGEGMKNSPRRAFDEKGEYVDTAVAIAKMADFTRSLKKNGRETGLVGNGPTPAFLATRSDSIMSEQPPYHDIAGFVTLRYASGHKLITVWNSWRMNLRTDDMTPEQIRQAYRGAADFMHLTSFRYGAFPSPRWSLGVAKLTKALPTIKSVIAQGWQAVPAVRSTQGELPEYIWPARYGSGSGSTITIGNAAREDWQGEIAIDNDYLGATNFLFADRTGKTLPQTVRGRSTILQVQIPSHETLILRAIAAVPANAQGAATVSWSDDGAQGALRVQSTFTPSGVLPPRDGWKFAARRGTNWEFTSTDFATPIKEILDFPFFDEARTAQIVLPQKATAKDEADAKLLQGYFIFWGRNGINPPRELQLPIVPFHSASAQDAKIYPGAPATKREGNALYVRDVSALLDALDQKYFYCGNLRDPFPGGLKMLKKAGLENSALPSE
jgi:hypothetical protein